MTDVIVPTNDLTEIAVVLDRSGSMQRLKDDMEGGLWATVVEQHGLPGRCRVSLYQFDDKWEVVFTGKPSGEVTQEDCRLVPRGSTALNDAVVKSLADLEARILGEPEEERPGKVAVIVITDGFENASEENKKQDVRDAIRRATEKFGWKFVFLAADPDGFEEGVGMAQGFVGVAVAAYDAGDVKGMYAGTSRALGDYRSGHSELVDVDGNVMKDSDDSDGEVGGPEGVH